MDRIKAFFAGLPALFEQLKVRWPWLGRILGMIEHYTARRGNAYAAAISFIGMLSLVPILMVAFAAGAFVLASNPDLIEEITDTIVEKIPGELGTQLNDVIDSAIASRQTVGVIGLITAAFTGLGWMALVRNALSDMWGGRAKRSAVMGKVTDLVMFVALGLLFLVTVGVTVAALGPVGKIVQEALGIDGTVWGSVVLRVVSVVVGVCATWGMFIVVYSRLPFHRVPVRAVVPAAFGVAVVFEILKSVSSIYLKSVLSSPAGAAFGPILGAMVFAYLASRIVLYGAAWAASDPRNAQYQAVDEVSGEEDDAAKQPVYLAPVYEVSQAPKARELITAAGVGAAIGALASRRK